MAAKVPGILADLHGVRPADLDVRADDASGADLIAIAGQTFPVVVNKSTAAAPIVAAAKRAKACAVRIRRRTVPLVAVPFMDVVSRLTAEDYVIRDERDGIPAKDPSLLLDSWREAYQFSKHTVLRGYVAARSGDALLRFVADILTEHKMEYAATGLAAAWALTHSAAFCIAAVYLSTYPSPELLHQLGFREDARGANLWLVVSNDEGVFRGADENAYDLYYLTSSSGVGSRSVAELLQRGHDDDIQADAVGFVGALVDPVREC